MSAQRAMRVEPIETISAAAPPQRSLRAAARCLSDDAPASRAMRPAMRAIAAPVTFSVVRTRYATPAKKKAHPIATILAPLGVVMVLAGAGLSGSGYSFAAGQPVVDGTAAYAVVAEPNSTTVGEDDAVDPSLDTTSTLNITAVLDDTTTVEPISSEVADAKATDKQTKAKVAAAAAEAAAAAQAAAEQKAAEEAAAAAAAAAAQKQVAAAASKSSVYASFDTHDGNKTTQSYVPQVTPGEFILPVSGTLTSPFGYRHNPVTGAAELHTGNDLAAACGTPIHASAAGTVVSAGWAGSLGNYTEISHGNGIETGYGHQSKIIVKVGQHVNQGDVIGYVGRTGTATGCHVHFLAAYDGNVFNSLTLVK
jgi:murein DD-endopeptidase MepM/ murein hydrolase activator NlpD